MGEGAGRPGALPDVGDPAVPALALNSALGSPLVLALGRPGLAALGSPVEYRVLVGEVSQPPLAGHPLQVAVEPLGVGDVKAPSGLDVGVAHDDVRVRDGVLVVVVVDDGHLVLAEVSLRPAERQLAQALQVDLVCGVGAHDVVAVRDGRPAAVGLAVAVDGPELVHLRRPAAGLAAAPLHAVEVDEVVAYGAASPLEVALDGCHCFHIEGRGHERDRKANTG